MKVLFLSFLMGCAGQLIGAGNQAEEMRQASGSAKVDTFSDITPACSAIKCANIQCLAPLALTRREGQCCAICWAPDHKVGLDRHTALAGGSPHAVDAAAAAPSNCAGAKCFKPACRPGQNVHHTPGRCCNGCA